MAERPRACPSCGEERPAGERFCSSCGMPLVQGAGEALEAPVSERHGRARKINPLYTQGRLVRVAGGRNQPEAELIQGMLLEEGVPSMLRRSAGFDVPDFLAAGPRDVLVPAAGAEAARELLREAGLAPPAAEAHTARPSTLKVAAAIALAGTLTAVVAWLLQSSV